LAAALERGEWDERQELIGNVDTTTPIPAYKMALAGSMAGGFAGFLGNPAELVMVRMQADKAKPADRKSKSTPSPS
jgi:dicarboxylate transporter 10